MEFNIAKNQIKENIGVAMRSAGYHKIEKEGQNSRLSFVKPLSRAGYPRFHIYLKESKAEYVFNLHLDQKGPVYPHTKQSYGVGVNKGTPAHQGEYNGQIIQEEVERIKQKLLK